MRRLSLVCALTCAVTLLPAASASALQFFTAYNDFYDADMQSVANTTEYGTGSPPVGGLLTDYWAGAPTDVDMQIDATFSEPPLSLSGVALGAHPTTGDALARFGSIGTSTSGVGYVGAINVKTMTLTFSNLIDDYRHYYDVSLYSNLVSSGSREVRFTISGADSFDNTSTTAGLTGDEEIGTDYVTLNVLTNTGDDRHKLARFSNIKPGADGIFVITIAEETDHSSNGLLVNMMRFDAVPEPATLTLLAVGAIGAMVRRRRR